MAMYETGQIDVTPVGRDYIDLVKDEASPFHRELAITPELSLYYIGFNTAKPLFDDVNVRRAFCYAVDKERIIKLTLRDMVSKAEGILPPGMPGYNQALNGLDYDVDKAKALIATSSYGDVSSLPPITITTSGWGGNISPLLGAVINEWRQNLGVEIEVRQLEPHNFLYHTKQEKDEMYELGWIADYPDPQNFLDILFRTGSEPNVGEYSNPEVDTRLDAAATEGNVSLRLQMYHEVEQRLVDDATCLPLYFGQDYTLVKPYVKGYRLSPQGLPNLSDVYIER